MIVTVKQITAIILIICFLLIICIKTFLQALVGFRIDGVVIMVYIIGETLLDIIGNHPEWIIILGIMFFMSLFAQFLLYLATVCLQMIKGKAIPVCILLAGAGILCLLADLFHADYPLQIHDKSTLVKNDSDIPPKTENNYHNTGFNNQVENNNPFQNANKEMVNTDSSVLVAQNVSENTKSSDWTTQAVSGNAGTGVFNEPPQKLNITPDSISQSDNTIKLQKYSTNDQTHPSRVLHTSFDNKVQADSSTANIKGIDTNKIAQELKEYNEKQSELNELKRCAILRARASVVHIEAMVYSNKDQSNSNRTTEETGSGFLISIQKRVFVITNCHVAGLAVSIDNVSITLRNKKIIHPFNIIPCPQADIALLEIKSSDLPENAFLTDFTNVKDDDVLISVLADSDQVQIMDSVYSIGSPFGLEGSISTGIISSKNRRNIPLGTPDQIQNFFQTDASINPGNSGGPLVNQKGEVIGIVTAIASKTGQASGIAFALPTNNFLPVVEQIVSSGAWTQSYLGVNFDDDYNIAKHKADGLDQLTGARITEVKERSPAQSIGLVVGDVIITYNNQPVQDNSHLKQLIALSPPGSQPELYVLRNKTIYKATPSLVKRTVYANNSN